MKTEYGIYEYSNGKFRRRVYYYDDDGDIIMTDCPVYEEKPPEEEEEDAGLEYSYYDGPEDSEGEEPHRIP